MRNIIPITIIFAAAMVLVGCESPKMIRTQTAPATNAAPIVTAKAATNATPAASSARVVTNAAPVASSAKTVTNAVPVASAMPATNAAPVASAPAVPNAPVKTTSENVRLGEFAAAFIGFMIVLAAIRRA
jgi:hypothetical protein